MADTGVRGAGRRSCDRFTSFYRAGADGGLELVDAPDGQWSSPPAFPSGAGGLVSTVDDWLALRPDAARRRARRRPPAAVAGVGAADDHRPPDRRPSATPARCSSRARAGASAARSTSRPSTRGTCPAATAGSAAPGRRRTSSRPPARSRSCSPSWRWPARPRPRHAGLLAVRRRASELAGPPPPLRLGTAPPRSRTGRPASDQLRHVQVRERHVHLGHVVHPRPVPGPTPGCGRRLRGWPRPARGCRR